MRGTIPASTKRHNKSRLRQIECSASLLGKENRSAIMDRKTNTTETPQSKYVCKVCPICCASCFGPPERPALYCPFCEIPLPSFAMSFAEAVKTCLKKYMSFSGRARRSEYWWFTLFYLAAGGALWVMSGIAPVLLLLSKIWMTGLFLPGLSACFRRLHDTGRKAAYLFWLLVPVYGIITVMNALLEDSSYGPNAYGEWSKLEPCDDALYICFYKRLSGERTL